MSAERMIYMPRCFIAGAGEKMQYLVHEQNDNTIRFALHYPGVPDIQALRCAARQIVGSVDVLHAAFHPGKLTACWVVSRDYPDEDFFRHEHIGGDPMERAAALSLEPVAHDSRVQLRFSLVENGTESALVMNVSHLCVDGTDAKYLLYKLAQGCSLYAAQGSCDQLSIKHGVRAAEQVYRGLDAQEMRSLLRDPRSGVKSAFPFPSEEEGTPRLIMRTIPPETMAAAHSRAKARAATVNDILLAACYHAYAAVPGVDPHAPMSITSMLDLRRHLEGHDSPGLSNLSGALPSALSCGIHPLFEDTVADIAAQTRRTKEDPLAGLAGMPLLHGATKTIPLGLLQMAASRLYGGMSVGLTNLGSIDCGALSLGGLTPDAGWFGGPLKKKPGMQVCASSIGGACALCIVGQYTDEDAAVLHALLDHMVGTIAAYAGDAARL